MKEWKDEQVLVQALMQLLELLGLDEQKSEEVGSLLANLQLKEQEDELLRVWGQVFTRWLEY